MPANISKTLSHIYGTGNFNPRRIDHKSHGRGRKLYLWVLSFLFLAIAGAIVAGLYFFSRTPDSFTGDKVETRLEGQINPLIGQDETYKLLLTNNEAVDLDNLELFIGWSARNFLENESGVRLTSANGEEIDGSQNTWQLGGLKRGEEKEFQFVARFFGNEGTKLELPFRLTFRPANFTSDFTTDFNQEFILGASTVDLRINGPESAAEGSEIALSVDISAIDLSSVAMLNNSWLELEYPDNFSVISEDPKKEKDAVGWSGRDLPIIGDGDGDSSSLRRQLAIRGSINGVDASELKFPAKLFEQKGGRLLSRDEKTISLANANLEIDISASPAQGKKLQWGEKLTYNIAIKNISSYVMRNMVVSVNLSGDELWRPGSIDIGQGGIFESGAIIWDEKTTSELDSLQSSGSLKLSFSLETVSSPPANFSGTPVILAKGRARGMLGDQDATIESGEIISKILSIVEFNAGGEYKSGPNPPLSGQETSYTLTWAIGPTSGALKDLRVAAKLPADVSWSNKTDLAVGEIKYDAASREVIWQTSRVPKLDQTIMVSFDIKAMPAKEVTDDFVLLEQTKFIATDEAAGEEMQLINFPLTLRNVRQ